MALWEMTHGIGKQQQQLYYSTHHKQRSKVTILTDHRGVIIIDLVPPTTLKVPDNSPKPFNLLFLPEVLASQGLQSEANQWKKNQLQNCQNEDSVQFYWICNENASLGVKQSPLRPSCDQSDLRTCHLAGSTTLLAAYASVPDATQARQRARVEVHVRQ